jgi:hypothetical protein
MKYGPEFSAARSVILSCAALSPSTDSSHIASRSRKPEKMWYRGTFIWHRFQATRSFSARKGRVYRKGNLRIRGAQLLGKASREGNFDG